MRRARWAVLGVLLVATGCTTAVAGTASPAPVPAVAGTASPAPVPAVALTAEADISTPGADAEAAVQLLPLADGTTLVVSHVVYSPTMLLTTVRPGDGVVSTVPLDGGGTVFAVRQSGGALTLLASRTQPDETQDLVVLEVDPATGTSTAVRPVSGGPDDLARTYIWGAVTPDGEGFVLVVGQFDGLPAEVLAVDAATGQVTQRAPLDLGDAADDDALIQPQGLAIGPDGGVVVAVSIDRAGDARNSALVVRLTPDLAPDGPPVELAEDAPSAEFHAAVSGSDDLVLTADGSALVAVIVGEDTDDDSAGARLEAVSPEGESRTLLEVAEAELSGLVLGPGGRSVLAVRESVAGDRTELSAVQVPLSGGDPVVDVPLCPDGDTHQTAWDQATGAALVTGSCGGTLHLWALA